MAAGCPFCEIVERSLDAPLVFEDSKVLAFLDNRPLFPGHCLMIPKKHYETLPDLPADEVGPLFGAARLLARAVESGMGADGSFIAINNRVSQSVPHLHVHIVPRKRKDGLRGFFWPRGKYRDQAEINAVQAAIRAALEGANGRESLK